MDDSVYRKWLESIDALSEAQRADVETILAGRSSEAEVIAALEGRVLAERICAHCQRQGAVAEQVVCAGSTAIIAARPLTPSPERRWRICTTRDAGSTLPSRLAKAKRCASRRTGVTWR